MQLMDKFIERHEKSLKDSISAFMKELLFDGVALIDAQTGMAAVSVIREGTDIGSFFEDHIHNTISPDDWDKMKNGYPLFYFPEDCEQTIRPLLSNHGIVSLIYLPLSGDGGLAGTICCINLHDTPGLKVIERARALMDTFSEQAIAFILMRRMFDLIDNPEGSKNNSSCSRKRSLDMSVNRRDMRRLVSDGTATVDSDGRVISDSSYLSSLLQISADDMGSLSLLDYIHPEDVTSFLRSVSLAGKSGKVTGDYRIIIPGNKPAYVRVFFVRRSDNAVDLYFCSLGNYKSRLDELSCSYRACSEVMTDIMMTYMIIDSNGTIVETMDNFGDITGHTGLLVKANVAEIIHDSDLQYFMSQAVNPFRHAASCNIRFYGKPSETHTVIFKNLIADDGTTLFRCLILPEGSIIPGSGKDLVFKEIFVNNSSDNIFLFDVSGRLIECTKSSRNLMVNVSGEPQLLVDDGASILDSPLLLGMINSVKSAGARTTSFMLRMPDGSREYAEAVFKPLYHRRSGAISAVSMTINLSSKDLPGEVLDAMVNNMGDISWFVDMSLMYRWISPSTEIVLGYSVDMIRSSSTLTTPSDSSLLPSLTAAFRAGISASKEGAPFSVVIPWTQLNRIGRKLKGWLNINLVYSANDIPLGFIGIFHIGSQNPFKIIER
jgi:PAS domain-containing protein